MYRRAAMAHWAELDEDMLGLIVKKLELVQDCLALGMVCKSWKKAAISNNKKYIRPQIPWLMLADEEEEENNHHDNTNRHRKICSVTKEKEELGSVVNLSIPREMVGTKCVGLNYGWILTISRTGDMYLVHPQLSRVIALPHQTSIQSYNEYELVRSYLFTTKAALSGNPSEGDDFVLVILHSGGLGYWRPGEESWKVMRVRLLIHDVIYYNDQFYFIDVRSTIWAFAIRQQLRLPDVRRITRIGEFPKPLVNLYIVGSSSSAQGKKLLVVSRCQQVDLVDEWIIEVGGRSYIVGTRHDGTEHIMELDVIPDFDLEENYRYEVDSFTVYEVDLMNGESKQIESLGDRALFLGCNTSTLFNRVSESFPGLEPNHIYFTDDNESVYQSLARGGGKDMGRYSLEDAKVTKFNVAPSFSQISPPFWFIPSPENF